MLTLLTLPGTRRQEALAQEWLEDPSPKLPLQELCKNPAPEDAHQPHHVRLGDPRQAAAGAGVCPASAPSTGSCVCLTTLIVGATVVNERLCRIVRNNLQSGSGDVGRFSCPFALTRSDVSDHWPLPSSATSAAVATAYSSLSTCSISGIMGIKKCSSKHQVSRIRV